VPFNPPLSAAEVDAALTGKFRVTGVVASGGQGTVFKANGLQAATGAAHPVVALKIYFEDQVEERTAREIAALRSLRCDTIVRLFDDGKCSLRGKSCIYIATTFIEGETLADAIGRGPLSAHAVADIAHDIALAIDDIWKGRVVHRDIKPGNIMITPRGRAVLIDLGLARHLSLSPLTSAGKTWGTEGYFSPEHARGAQLTCKADVFSLGIVLQEALLGRHPTGRKQMQLLQGGPSTGALRAGLPHALITLVDAMVHKNAVSRPMPFLIVSRSEALRGGHP
jgi:eukaryotic-like serine/threonine-protein kinase